MLTTSRFPCDCDSVPHLDGLATGWIDRMTFSAEALCATPRSQTITNGGSAWRQRSYTVSDALRHGGSRDETQSSLQPSQSFYKRCEVCGPLELCDLRLVERFCQQLLRRFPRIHAGAPKRCTTAFVRNLVLMPV